MIYTLSPCPCAGVPGVVFECRGGVKKGFFFLRNPLIINLGHIWPIIRPSFGALYLAFVVFGVLAEQKVCPYYVFDVL